MSERGQISVAACGLLVLLVLAGLLLGTMGDIDRAGASAQRAADMAALAAAQALAAQPSLSVSQLRQAAARSAAANGARLASMSLVRHHGLPAGVAVELWLPEAGEQVRAHAQAAVSFAAGLPDAGFRPIDLHGAVGRAAVVAAAAAQVGWPYVWGGESRAEGGFDCSGLIDFAYAAAGSPLPGRPTAAALWSLAAHTDATGLLPGDLVFAGAGSGAPYHVGMYVGEGMVLSAPHAGARVGYAPLAGGGWDGFGRLLAGDALAPAEGAAAAAARRHGVPAHVIESELRLGLATDPEPAARALAAALERTPSLEQALAEQLGDPSAAALVLRDGSGSALELTGSVRLVPDGHAVADERGAADALPAAPPALSPRPSPGPGGWSLADHLGTALGAGEQAAEQLSERGRAMPLQAAAALVHGSRFALTGLGALLPDPDWRDAANLAGSGWDLVSASQALAESAGAGAPLTGFGLWAARFSLVGGLLSTGVFTAQALAARRTRDRVGYGLMAAGSAATTAGLLSAGGSMLALGAAGTVVPPVGLALIAVGAGLCLAGYLARHPEWCRAAVRLGGRALDLAWRVQTAPVRLAATAASAAADGARAVIDAIPTPW